MSKLVKKTIKEWEFLVIQDPDSIIDKSNLYARIWPCCLYLVDLLCLVSHVTSSTILDGSSTTTEGVLPMTILDVGYLLNSIII